MVAGFKVHAVLNQMEYAMHELNIPAMSCGHCVGAVNKTIKSVDPEATVEIDLPTRIVRIQTEKTRQAIAEALIDSGYPPR